VKIRSGPEGLHLFDRRSGLNVLLDEVSLPPDAWSPAPRYMSIALTNSCNLQCPYCYAPKSSDRLAADDVVMWAHELDDAGCLGIGFGGGEPTLFRGFAALCRQLATTTRLSISFTTHGHRLTRALVAELDGSVHFLRLSMDGIGATYERLRGRPFRVFLERVSHAREIAPFGINYVVNAETITHLPQAVELAFEHGASEFLLLPEVPTEDRPGIDASTLERLSSWVARHHLEYRLAISERGSETIEAPLLRSAGARDPLSAFAHIDAWGTLKACAFDRSGVSIADHAGVIPALEALRETRNSTTEEDT
jgi:MoaA/NifB/PqqE/SkfB family radical SAM enzyme